MAAFLHALLDWTALDPRAVRGFPGAPNSVQVALVLAATALYARLLARDTGPGIGAARGAPPIA